MSEAYGQQLCDCSRCNDVSGVESLLSRSDKLSFIDYKDEDGMTALHGAAFDGHSEIVKLLISNGCDANTKTNYNGETAIHCATSCGHLEVVKLLIYNGCDVNAMSNWGETGLHWAVCRELLEIATLLINNGCDVNITDKNGYTALHAAATYGHLEIAALLINNGCDLNVTDKVEGKIALHIAVSNGHLELATLLIKKTCEQGQILSIDFFDNDSLQLSDRESLLLVFDKAMRRYRRLQVLWMSSSICIGDSNIMNLLSIDLCRSVLNFI